MVSLSDYATDERTARVLISLVTGNLSLTASRLVSEVGGVETIRLLDSDGVMPLVDPESATILRRGVQRAADETNLGERMRDLFDGRYATLIPGDAHWPVSVNDLSVRAPLVLWTRGATSLLAGSVHDRVTLTGARASTEYGNHVAAELAVDTVLDERIVVAGGSYGIEAAAHRAALTEGHTVAVLPGGVDVLYPSHNQDLLERVADYGLLVSEQLPGSVPTRDTFKARPRLLAALSSAAVVVEAGPRSGSLAVLREARAIGRPVGAVPGPVTSIASTGPNGLLRDGFAAVVTDMRDLTKLMDLRRPEPEKGPARSQGFTRGEPEPERDSASRSL